LFGAAWAAGYLARAVAGGVEAVTLLGPGGPFGVADATRRRPAFYVLQSFAAAAGAPSLACVSSQPQRLLGCACVKDGRSFLWLVNLTPDTLPVTLAGLRPARVMLLEENEPTEHSPDAPLALSPYAIAFIEG
jgi:D-apionolactonase